MLNFRPLYNAALKIDDPCIYRSGELINLSEDHITFITSNLGINYYLDLRSDYEINNQGKPKTLIAAGVKWLHVPIEHGVDYPRSKAIPDYYDYFDSYKHLLEYNKQQFRKIFLSLASIYRKKCIYACFAGKDRTGVLSILIMLLLNAKLDDVADEYVASSKPLLENIDYFETKWKQKGLTKQQYAQRLIPDRRTAVLLVEYINNHYQDIHGYLKSTGLSNGDYMDMVTDLKTHYIAK